MHLDIDISFSCREVDQDGVESSSLSGTVTADGTHVQVHTDAPGLLEKPTPGAVRMLKAFADELAEMGVSATISGPDGELLSIGDVDAPVLQRVVTRSRHIRLGSLTAAAKSMLSSPPAGSASPAMLPPATPWPPVPTFSRRIRRRVTTTHSAPGSGRPRLVMVKDDGSGPGPLMEFNLVGDRTVIGSDETCDLRLAGLEPFHAEVIHDEFDEYLLSRRGAAGGSVSGSHGAPVTLRTGSRIDMGPWRLVYIRAEFADHGRPFGGRQGGELAYQRPQYNPYTHRVENRN
ncbi:FHA domain-containing protein [Nesterenkonia xinjiangensis]|uniref:FHA domain-containing protein n=1 Tax=Nesterenkonia xinjiangensis TaxID=225327 RepID=A0A7Z0GL31_9MICC|nr:FHA domain-containing protein [Nesterenkonia xinjiangensis]NYJ77905.1 hypothetical protein [Nesterenkonia xinjiangensis]